MKTFRKLYESSLRILIANFDGAFNAHKKLADLLAYSRGRRDGARYAEEYTPSLKVYVQAGRRNASSFTTKDDATQRYLAGWIDGWYTWNGEDGG